MKLVSKIFVSLLLLVPFQAFPGSGSEIDPSKQWHRDPKWGAAWPTDPRVTIRWPGGSTGGSYRLEMKIDGAPFETIPILEGGGADPFVHVLNDNLIAYLGCGKVIAATGNENCPHLWRILNTANKKAFTIEIPGFEHIFRMPVFYKSHMAYATRLANGNGGCKIYDWSTSQFIGEWDSGENIKEIAVSFKVDRSIVSCKVITGWKPNPAYMGGDVPRELPVYGKTSEIAIH